jgi:membrane protein DedA with SNARE-associated domain
LWASLLALAALLVLLVGLAALTPIEIHPEKQEASGPWPYVVVFGLVFGDAIIPLLPGETTLNTASTLAAQGVLELGWVMVAGAAGAVLGDSALYWIAHLARRRVQTQVSAAMSNPKVATAMEVIGSSAGALLVFGRYVPGLRFVVNATLGLARHPYGDFLRWSVLGGVTWSIYICGVAYAVGTVLENAPFAAIAVSALASSVAVAVVFVIVARRARRLRAEVPDDAHR